MWRTDGRTDILVADFALNYAATKTCVRLKTRQPNPNAETWACPEFYQTCDSCMHNLQGTWRPTVVPPLRDRSSMHLRNASAESCVIYSLIHSLESVPHEDRWGQWLFYFLSNASWTASWQCTAGPSRIVLGPSTRWFSRGRSSTFLSLLSLSVVRFYRAAWNADAVLRWDFCPSVCLSVWQTRALWQNGRKICLDFYIIRKNIYPSFLRRRMVGGGRPLLPEILGQPARVGAKSPILNR